MKKIITSWLTLLVVLWASVGWGADAIYYINSSAADGGNGLTSATAFNTLSDLQAAQWNALNSAATAGDDAIIYLAVGSSWNEKLAPTNQGVSGHKIYVTPYGEGEKPIIDGTGQTHAVYTSNLDFFVFRGLTLKEGTTATSGINGGTYIDIEDCSFVSGVTAVIIQNASTNISISDCDIDGGYSGIGVALLAGTETQTDISISGLISEEQIKIDGTVNVSMTDITLASVDTAINIDAGSDGTIIIDGFTISDSTNYGIYIYTTSGVTLQAKNGTVTNSSSHNIYLIANGDLGEGSIFQNVTSTLSAGDAMRVDDSGNFNIYGGAYSSSDTGIYLDDATTLSIVIDDVLIDGNSVDGISFDDGAGDTEIKNCIISNNGSDIIGNGDGITAHDASTGISAHHNIITGNWNSDFAVIDSSAGVAYHNVVKYNGKSGKSNVGVRGGYYATGIATWTLKNNIFEGNYPYELYIGADQGADIPKRFLGILK